MNFTIRPAEKKDMPDVLDLILELADYEKEPDAVEIQTDDLIEQGFSKDPSFFCFVAETDNGIEGMALFYYRFSTWKGKTVHLEDLIVRKNSRQKGIGSALYRKVMQFAQDRDLKRVEWVVLDWNENAINFYRKTGARVFEKWNTVQFDENGLKNYLDS